MKSEDELLIELRDGLAKFVASTMKMQRVEARDFPAVDPAFYDRMAARLSGLGFNPVGRTKRGHVLILDTSIC